MNILLKTSLALIGLALIGSAQASTIGLWGDDNLASNIFSSGNGVRIVSGQSSLQTLQSFDQIWLIRTNGSQALKDYVWQGGVLVTEWSASTYAASLIDVQEAFGCSGCERTVSFTLSGTNIGLGATTGASYTNGGANDHVRSFTNLGADVSVIARGDVSGLDIGVAGHYGSGYVVALGWDWRDAANDSITQSLFKDIANISSFGQAVVQNVSAPTTISAGLFALLAFGFRRKT
jgi:hypothetical protein